jgi:hypothetical protein
VKKLGKFFKAMFTEWGSGLSGGASVPLTVLALYNSGSLLRILYGILAALVGFYSAYSVWSREYDRAEHELSLNTRPEIKPHVLYLFWAYPSGYNSQPTQIYASLRLTNLRDVPTTITGYRLIVTSDNRTVDGPNDVTFRGGTIKYERCNVTVPGAVQSAHGRDTLDMFPLSFRILPQAPLTKGIHFDGWLAFDIDLTHLHRCQSPSASVVLEVTDPFDGKHRSEPTDLVIHYAEEFTSQS